MKLIHLSDLHLGKRVNEFSMLEDQAYILRQILSVVEQECPQAVIIAGDVYDKSMPSGEAVALFDEFLVALSSQAPHIFVIAGNHDSPQRIAYGARLMAQSGVHLSPVFTGEVEQLILEDAYGPVSFTLLPFLKPAHVRRFLPEQEEELASDGESPGNGENEGDKEETGAEPAEGIESYTQALAHVLRGLALPPSQRHVLVTHQFVTGAARSDSEDISVGGTDNVDAQVFQGFDYVALGHLHRPQQLAAAPEGTVLRYCGSPLKYSISEAGTDKSVTVVELLEKGNVKVRALPLVPLRDMREIRGTYEEITARSFYLGTCLEDYLLVTLTDEEDIPEALGKLRGIYPHIMKLQYDNVRTRTHQVITRGEEEKPPLLLVSEFYALQNNQPPSPNQLALLQRLMERIWEGEEIGRYGGSHEEQENSPKATDSGSGG